MAELSDVLMMKALEDDNGQIRGVALASSGLS